MTLTNTKLLDAVAATLARDNVYRNLAISQQKKINSSTLALFRLFDNFSNEQDQKTRDVKSKRAKDKLKRIEKAFKQKEKLLAKNIDPDTDHSWMAPLTEIDDISSYIGIGESALRAKREYDILREDAEQSIRETVILLPIYHLVKEIKGFGEVSLGIIVAEAGNISHYATPAKLWKRFGLGVLDGECQGKGLKGNPEKALKHGYSPRRRSTMFTIGDALIKQNKVDKETPKEYRKLYLAEKERQLAANPDMMKIQIHRRAQRKMEKELLKRIWNEWHSNVTQDRNST